MKTIEFNHFKNKLTFHLLHLVRYQSAASSEVWALCSLPHGVLDYDLCCTPSGLSSETFQKSRMPENHTKVEIHQFILEIQYYGFDPEFPSVCGGNRSITTSHGAPEVFPPFRGQRRNRGRSLPLPFLQSNITGIDLYQAQDWINSSKSQQGKYFFLFLIS